MSHLQTALWAISLTAALGCSTPIGVTRESPKRVHQTLTASVLTSGEPSPFTRALLDRRARLEEWHEDPEAVLLRLHESLAAPDLPGVYWQARLAALAELSFHRAMQTGSRAWYRAAAVYAYTFLFSDPDADLAETLPFDPRVRLVVDLYNRGVTDGFSTDDGQLELAPGSWSLPFGSLSLTMDPEERAWGSYRLTRLTPAAELRIRGLRNRHRRPGIGAPVAANIAPTEDSSALERQHVPPGVVVPVSVFLRIEHPRQGLASGRFEGRIELHAADTSDHIEVAGRRVPLELETTSALALGFDDSPVWQFERSGFFSGDFRPDLGDFDGQLAMMHPYRRGRVPVVLVHGTASSPGRWGELLNELTNDPVIGPRCQFWMFFYNSGSPIGYSGGILAGNLRRLARELDPERLDPALQNMVVAGHSQGGLLTKLTVVESGRRFWDGVFPVAPEELEVDPETRELLVESLIFEPVSAVSRVVFISTPHGGSFLADRPGAGLVRRSIKAPFRVARRIGEAIENNPDDKALRVLEELPTSLDNMTAGNPFLETLRALPVAPGVDVHSIVPVKGDGPPDELDDGVVTYRSAHIERGSEKIVRHGHSVQAHPETVAEMRRILREHLAELGSRAREGSEVGPPAPAP